MKQLEFESFEYFVFGNIDSGSDGKFNYKVFPSKEDMNVRIWYGQYCLDKSEMVSENTFPLTEEGYEAMNQWIMEEQKKFYKR